MTGFATPDLPPPHLLWAALGRVTNSMGRDAATKVALEIAGERKVPEDPNRFTQFVLGPLRRAAEEQLGADTADKLVAELAPFLHGTEALDLGPTSGPVRRAEVTLESEEPAYVLVVHNDFAVRSSLTKLLTGRGYKVLSAPDGQVALALATRRRPAIVLAALELPSPDGDRLAALLRVAFGAGAPKVVLLIESQEGIAPHDNIVQVLREPVPDAAVLLLVEGYLGPAVDVATS